MDLVRTVFKYGRVQWDRVGALVSIGAGAVALLIGWVGVSSTTYPSEQIPYVVSGAMTGLFLLGVGIMLWLSADLRDQWRRIDAVARGQNPPPAFESRQSEERRPTEPTAMAAHVVTGNGAATSAAPSR